MPVAHALMGTYLATLMFSLGLGLSAEPGGKKASRREKISIFSRGLVLTLFVVPLVALGVVRALRPSSDVTIALLLLVAAPGGRYAPQLARLATADVGVSTELTLLLVKLTAFTAPVMTKWLLGGHRAAVRDLPLILSLLLLQVVPLYLGKAVRRWKGAFAQRIERLVRLVVDLTALVLFLALVVILRGVHGLALIGGRGWLAIIALACVAGGIGWLAGGPADRTRRAMTIAANAHNGALAFIIADSSFPEGSVRSTVLAIWMVLLCLNSLFALVCHGREARPPIGERTPPAHALQST